VKYKKISFDWDNTIAMSYMIDSEDDSDLPIYNFQGYNSILIDLIKDYYNQGIELHIVTSRKTSLEEYYPEDSVEYQLKLLKLDHIFPSVRVHFTEGDLKAKTLKQIGIDLHYDDSIEEILECKRAGIEVVSSLKTFRDTNTVAKGIITDIHGSILLLKRTDEGTKWDIPGGHIKQIEVDRGLKGLADGYEREVGEETGLIVGKSRLIHKYIHVWKEENMDMNIILSDFALEEPHVDLDIQDFQENSEYVWVQEDELHFFMDNMTEVATIAINFYLENMDNEEIMEGKYLPSQAQSWARMKKTLIGLGKNKNTGGGKGHTRPSMKKSMSGPSEFSVLEDREVKKKELRSKLSKILASVKENSTKRKKETMMDVLNDIENIFSATYNNNISEKDKNIQLAETLQRYMKDINGNPFEQVKIKGSGYGYYYSMSDKKTIMVPRSAEYYLISDKTDKEGRLRVYTHYKFMSGAVLLVPKEEIERIGWN